MFYVGPPRPETTGEYNESKNTKSQRLNGHMVKSR